MSEVSKDSRAATLASALESKVAQGHTIESQNDTEAIVSVKGRKRWFRSSSSSRQHVTVDETGRTQFRKIDGSGEAGRR